MGSSSLRPGAVALALALGFSALAQTPPAAPAASPAKAAPALITIPTSCNLSIAERSSTTICASRFTPGLVGPSNIPARSPTHSCRSAIATSRASAANVSGVAATFRAISTLGVNSASTTSGSVGSPPRPATSPSATSRSAGSLADNGRGSTARATARSNS